MDDAGAAGRSFTLDQGLRARAALRREAGLGEERFPMPDLMRMIGDEIDALRDAGRDDAAIARIVGEAIGAEMGPDDLRHHDDAPPGREPSR